jgi:hypothetical protein
VNVSDGTFKKRGVRMKRSFESDLGRRVAEKDGHARGKKLGMLVGALAVCALMISSALVSNADNQPAKDTDVMWDNHEDVILGSEGEVDLKRTMTLKNKTMSASGATESDYTVFNYTVRLSVNDDNVAEAQQGAMVGGLSIMIDGATYETQYTGVYDATWELIAPDQTLADSSAGSSTITCGAEAGSIEFAVPFPEVTSGYKILLNVTLTFGVGFLHGEVTESWGDSAAEDTDGLCYTHTARFDPVESYPGPQWLL